MTSDPASIAANRPAVSAEAERMSLADMRRRGKAIFIGSVGNLVEWYDFYAYAAFALYFAHRFFPAGDPVVFSSGRSVACCSGTSRTGTAAGSR
jgi:hypothetical protein